MKHVGLRIKIMLEDRSVASVAKAVGIGRPALSRMLNGKADLSIELAIRLSEVYGFDYVGLLAYQLKRNIEYAIKHRSKIN